MNTVSLPSEVQIKTEIDRLDELLTMAENAEEAYKNIGFDIGDQLNKMTDPKGNFKMTIPQIAKFFLDENGKPGKGRSRSRLQDLATISRTVSSELRQANPDVSIKVYENIVKTAHTLERNAKKELGEVAADFTIDIQKELKIAADKAQNSTRGAIKNLTKDMASRAREELMPFRFKAAEAAISEVPNEIVNQCHLGDYASILEQLPDGSIQMIHADPPYAHYTKTENGMLDFSTSAAMAESANVTERDALETTAALFPLAAKKLRKDGVLLLWQAGRHLRPEIIAAAEENGFEIGLPIIWDKTKPQAGDIVSAIQISTEFCWIIQRAGEKPWRKSELGREQVWKWQPVQHSAASISETHIFQKPPEANMDLIQLFSSEGDLVFIPFGCSGGDAVASIELKRNWVYCEMNEANFKLGFTNIQAALKSRDGEPSFADDDDEPEADANIVPA